MINFQKQKITIFFFAKIDDYFPLLFSQIWFIWQLMEKFIPFLKEKNLVQWPLWIIYLKFYWMFCIWLKDCVFKKSMKLNTCHTNLLVHLPWNKISCTRFKYVRYLVSCTRFLNNTLFEILVMVVIVVVWSDHQETIKIHKWHILYKNTHISCTK